VLNWLRRHTEGITPLRSRPVMWWCGEHSEKSDVRAYRFRRRNSCLMMGRASLAASSLSRTARARTCATAAARRSRSGQSVGSTSATAADRARAAGPRHSSALATRVGVGSPTRGTPPGAHDGRIRLRGRVAGQRPLSARRSTSTGLDRQEALGAGCKSGCNLSRIARYGEAHEWLWKATSEAIATPLAELITRRSRVRIPPPLSRPTRA
jgi:hypothetical protein